MGARIAWNNLLVAPTAVITSSSDATASGYIHGNLANTARWKGWRSASSTGDQWAKFDLGSNQSMQVLAAMNAVIHPGGTLKLQANTSDAWVTPAVNVTVSVPTTDYTRVWATWLTAAQSLRWVRFYFTNTGAVDTYVELGAAFAGTYLEPARSLTDTLSVRRVDPSSQRYSTGGQRSSVIKAKYHEVSGTFGIQKASARNDLRKMFETIGATTPALFTLDANDPSLTFYGTLTASLTAMHRASDLWDVPIEFVEDVA